MTCPAWEGVVGAATDTYARLDQITTPADDDDPARPVFTALPLASNFAAFHAATAIVMALIARERDGVGQRIEVPMFDAMFELIGANGISVDGDYRMSRSRGTPTYVCADGRRILFNSTSMPRFRRWFAEAAGTDTPSAELFLTRSALEWETAINAAGGPTAMVRTPSEWLAEPARPRATNRRATRRSTARADVGCREYRCTSRTAPGEIRPRHLPDADHAAVVAQLRALDARPATAAAGATTAGPLAGIRVLDFTQVVAGPCTGRILVEYGADVVKINQAHPESLAGAYSAEPTTHRPRQPAARAPESRQTHAAAGPARTRQQ